VQERGSKVILTGICLRNKIEHFLKGGAQAPA